MQSLLYQCKKNRCSLFNAYCFNKNSIHNNVIIIILEFYNYIILEFVSFVVSIFSEHSV